MELKRYLYLLLRWYWLIVGAVLLAGGVAYVLANNQPRVYQASSRLLIDEAPGSSGNEYSQLLLEQRLATTYVELIQLNPVLEETVRRLDLPYGPDVLASRLTVSAPTDTQILVVTVRDTDAERAAEVANTLSAVFIEQNEARQSTRFVESIDNWEGRMDKYRHEVQDLQEQIATLGEPESATEEVAVSQLQTALREAQVRYTEAFNNLEALRVEEARSSNNVILVEPARTPRHPVQPQPLSKMLLGAAVGGMVALGVVFLLDYLDDSARSPEQLEEASGLAPVGAIAHFRQSNSSERLVADRDPRAPVTEAYRVLRTNLSFAAIDNGLQTLLVTSASPGEGKSTTVANLAVVLAQAGKKVVVVDADLRRPTQHSIFQAGNTRGLTSALIESNTPLAHHLRESRIPNLRLLTSGPIPPNPAELLSSQRMLQLIETLKEEADIVVFDAPPVLTVADPSVLAPAMSGCLLVAKAGETQIQAFIQATDALHTAQANLLGFVLNQIPQHRAGYYAYYQYPYTDKRSERLGLRRWLPQWLANMGRLG